MTGTHEAAGQALLRAIESVGEKPTIIVLVGLSGSGKSTVVSEYQERITELSGVVVPYESVRDTDASLAQSIVTTATPNELVRLEDDAGSLTIVTVVLRGMSIEETREHIGEITTELSAEDLAIYSLGIPVLADLLVRCNLDAPGTAKVAASYLHENLQGSWEDMLEMSRHFLQIPPNEATVAELKSQPEGFFGWYGSFQRDLFQAVKEWGRRLLQGEVDESPMVVAESERIFTEMLTSQRYPRVLVFFPAMEPLAFADFQRSLGYHGGRYDMDSPRMGLFGASYRKAGILSVSPDGDKTGFLIEQAPLDAEFEVLAVGCRDDNCPIARLIEEETGAILLSKREHHGLRRELVKFCWAAESWLQQRGIAYLCVNYHYGQVYCYLPDTRSIQMLRPTE